ncbi:MULTISPECIES: RNA polymerase sigma factor [Streptomyces phaeochromogenes group]|uniref:RNA polymerase sigma factor n=1 Tax=Streptomyces phaeochromogenes group TaxID=2838332 RepID=UPI0033E0D4C3
MPRTTTKVGADGQCRKRVNVTQNSAASRELAAFSAFYVRHYRTGLQVCRDSNIRGEDAEDVVNGAMLALWQAWSRVNNPQYFYRRVVQNMASQVIAKEIKARDLLARIVNVDPAIIDALRSGSELPGRADSIPHQVHEQREAAELAIQTLATISEPLRISVALSAEGLSTQERAAFKGVPEGTERVHLHRGLASLRQKMNEPDLRTQEGDKE